MTYTADNIKVLEGLEAVRLRPAMYIGDTNITGLHHLIWEVIDNCIDEAMIGECNTIQIACHPEDNSIEISDNGRGIPVDIHPVEKIPAATVVLTKLHAGGKFDDKTYSASGGLHGVGISCVNALSEKLQMVIHRNKKSYTQTFKKGIPVTELITGKPLITGTGTSIRFWPDPEIFPDIIFDQKIILKKIEELSYLNPNVIFTYAIPGEPTKTFKSENGLSEFVLKLNAGKAIHKDPIFIKGEKDKIRVEIALQWTSKYLETTLSYCNNINTREGGTHLVGFKAGLTNAVNRTVMTPEFIAKNKIDVIPEDIREGLTAIVSVRVPQPQFEGQTKTKLGTSAVKGIVQTITSEALKEFFEEKPHFVKPIQQKILHTAKVRLATQKARDNARKVDSLVSDTSLVGKLADCQASDPSERELFIVEGDSAGGSAKQARKRYNQAILPIKGKILNVEKSNVTKMLASLEVQALISAVGVGIGSRSFDYSKLRYHKIIIMADADVDGSHIRTLLLTLFFRQMPELILNGNLWIACPPLFKLSYGKTNTYAYDESDLPLAKKSFGTREPTISRFKGLGEMSPETLWETTMNPEKRIMKKISISNAIESDQIFTMLMGDNPEHRANFITENALTAKIDL